MSTEAVRFDLTIRQGATWAQSLQWMQERKTYKAITACPQKVPLRFTVVGHGLPDGWPCFIEGVDGMEAANSADPDVPYTGLLVDTDTVELQNINADEFADYVSGGWLVYYTPFNLADYTSATMVIRASQGSASVLDTLSYGAGGVTFDTTLKLINLARTAVQTAAYAWTNNEGWYDLDATHSSGRVDRVAYGRVALARA